MPPTRWTGYGQLARRLRAVDVGGARTTLLVFTEKNAALVSKATRSALEDAKNRVPMSSFAFKISAANRLDPAQRIEPDVLAVQRQRDEPHDRRNGAHDNLRNLVDDFPHDYPHLLFGVVGRDAVAVDRRLSAPASSVSVSRGGWVAEMP